MAGAAKNRALKERKAKQEESTKPSPTSSQQSASPPQRLSPPSRFDGNRDPAPRSRTSSVASTGSAGARVAAAPLAGSPAVAGQELSKNFDLGARASFIVLKVSHISASLISRQTSLSTSLLSLYPTSFVSLNEADCLKVRRSQGYPP